MTAYRARAFETDLPDANADNRLSIYELYAFLSEQVEGYFISSGSLQTENPSLDDNGDGKVTTLAEGMDAGDGEYARTVLLTPAPSTAPAPRPTPRPHRKCRVRRKRKRRHRLFRPRRSCSGVPWRCSSRRPTTTCPSVKARRRLASDSRRPGRPIRKVWRRLHPTFAI